MPGFDKDRPSAEAIAQLRARFTCEPEIDRILTRKLEQRAGPGYRRQSLAELVHATAALIRARHGADCHISDARWLTGGVSKLQIAFTLAWTPPNGAPTRSAMVLRMESAESLVETSRVREFELLHALQGVVPVPPVYWLDARGEFLPYPAIVYGFMPGVTKPRDATSQASGMGTRLGARWRDALGPQFLTALACIHGHLPALNALPSFVRPAAGTAALDLDLDHWERVWEEDADEDVPLMRFAMAWLRAQRPACARPVLLHGDYRMGNFLFTEEDARITAILDWEMARFGDHHFDLAWVSHPAYGALADDGRTRLVAGLMEEAEFFARYEAQTGLAVDARRLHYYRVLAGFVQGTLALACAWRAARNGKTHQDALAAWIVGIGPRLLAELRDLLEAA